LISDAKKRANKKYNAKAYEQIKLIGKKTDALNVRIQRASEAAGMSKNAYIVAALEKQLEADGFGKDTIRPEDLTSL